MRRSVILLALLAGAPTAAAAQGWIEPSAGAAGVHKLRSEVTVHVDGRVARVEVREWFRNDVGGLAEGEYLYPLPGEAVFSDFALRQGEEDLRGETMDANEARSVYEEIVRRRRDPALIELVGHGLIRARVFPIPPGETRAITLRYTQLLERDGDALHFRYAASRRGTGGMPDRTRPAPGQPVPLPIRPQAQVAPPAAEDAPLTFTLIAEDGALFRDPFSPTHRLDVHRDGGRLVVRPDGELHGDLALFLPLARGLVGTTIVTHRPTEGEDGYFMLTLSPARARTAAALPRDVAVVLDVSGSMAGDKIEQAREALRGLLGSLGPQDRFRLIAFSSGVTTQAADWSPVTADALRAARDWIAHLEPNGGTNIGGALEEAFRVGAGAGRLPIVIFLTDGLPTVGEHDPERIAARAEADRGNRRVFAFGVGYDVNTYLLDRLGAAGRGASQYVQPGQDVETAIGTLAAKIRYPVLTDLSIGDAPVDLREIYPSQLPDLFAGEDLVVFGRYAGANRDRRGDVVVTGRRSGRAERFATTATFAAHEEGNAFIPRLWASRKLGVLVRTLRLEGPNADIEAEIRRTALRYGLLSEYTAYLVKEPEAQVAAGGVRPDFRGAAAPAPMRQSVGAAAVKAADAARARREVRSSADLAASEVSLESITVSGVPRDGRVIAGRLFEPKDGVWTDATEPAGLSTVRIRAYGSAYFELLRRLPELKPYFSEFEHVRVAGGRVALVVDDGGAERLTDAELDRLVEQFRATRS